MGAHHGKEAELYLSTAKIANVTGCSCDRSMSTADSSGLSDAKQKPLAGQLSGSGSFTAWWDETDTNGQVALETAFAAGTAVTFKFCPEGNTSGDVIYSATDIIITRMGIAVTKDGITEVSVSYEGVLDRSTVT